MTAGSVEQHQDPSPSYARRKALREADNKSGVGVMQIISTYPIEKYYDVADRLLAAFSLAMDDRRLDDAYVYGIRFATFSIESLPKHASYKKRQFNTLRLRNAKFVEDVLQKMESVTARMDAEERLLQQQREEEQRQRNKEQQQRMEQERAKKAHRQEDVERRARAKLAALMGKQHQEAESLHKGHSTRDPASKSNAAEEATLAQERQRLADQAEKLLHQQRAQEEADQEWETMKMLAREEHEDNLQQQRREREDRAPVAQQQTHTEQQQIMNEQQGIPTNLERKQKPRPRSTRAIMPHKSVKKDKKAEERTRGPVSLKTASHRPAKGSVDIQPTVAVLPSSSISYHKPTGIRPEEERTINLLRSTITRQEQRLKQTEEVQIPALRRKAKTHLAAGDRKTALHVMARKKKLEGQVDVWKGAVFTMETQILLLESAVEDREVAKAMKAATKAMESLQVDVSAEDLDDMNRVMEEMASGSVVDETVIIDEDELLEELEGPSGKNSNKATNDDFQLEEFLLSLPNAPDADMPVAEEQVTEPKKKSGRLLSGWF